MVEFDTCFGALYGDGRAAFPWQRRLYERIKAGTPPEAVDIPTGLGKTSAMAAWLLARATSNAVPNRLIYVVDRRTVVDQASEEAEKLANQIKTNATLAEVRAGLGLGAGESIAVSTLRGQHLDNKAWLADPTRPAIIIGTVDMIGSRLLFEGYGVSRKQRPIHAGLLGLDSLILLDEAHLVPPFLAMLKAVGADQDDGKSLKLWSALAEHRLKVTSLSATGRDPTPDRIELMADDYAIETVARRIGAAKPLSLQAIPGALSATDYVKTAMELTQQGARDVRVVLFATSRDEADKIAKALSTELAKANKGKGKTGPTPDARLELLVGARRMLERERAREKLAGLGFLPSAPLPVPIGHATFLIATSAGEVGVDLDADIMIADPVPFERMAQRLGRVNRRGDKNDTARVIVFAPSAAAKGDIDPRAHATVSLLRQLPVLSAEADAERNVGTDEALDASPRALTALRNRLPNEVAKASTPPPLRPALTKPLVEAWSMTSLKSHTGRPEVAPWLRGWVEDDPQVTVVFRRYLPAQADGTAPPKLLEAYFEAAPIQLAEHLETTGPQVANWLVERLGKGARKTGAQAKADAARGDALDEIAADTVPEGILELEDDISNADPTSVDADKAAQDEEIGEGAIGDAPNAKAADRARLQAETFVKASRVVALLLDRELKLIEVIQRPRMDGDANKDQVKSQLKTIKDRVAGAADGTTLVVWSGLGGLSKEGLLSDDDEEALAIDASVDTDEVIEDPSRFRSPFTVIARVEKATTEDQPSEQKDVRPPPTVVLKRDGSGMPEWWLDITVNDQNDLTRRVDEDRKALARHRQTLDGHQQDVAEALAGILGRLTVPVTAEERAALEFAARWHDQGKAVDRWQKAFRGKAYALTERRAERQPLFVGGPYAKSDVGQANQQILGGYRHEFGTLFDGPVLDALTQLSPDAQALALHLIASHHGHARPVIETAGVDDHPPSRVAAEATAVALRFAHLQERIGPWRLAWLEALVRAADAMASANPNKGVQHG